MSEATKRDFPVVVFDIDGTLLTTGGAGAKAWTMAFADLYGLTADITDFTEDGLPDHEVCRRTFIGVMGREPVESEISSLIASYLLHIDDTLNAATGYRVMPGIPELLERLSCSGVLLGITTGNVAPAAYMKLNRGRLARYFPFGGFGSDSPDRTVLTRKAIERAGRLLGHPIDPSRVLVVGDTPHDVEAAHGAHAVAVAVATGHYDLASLRATGAEHVLETVEVGFPV
jgi:phosphoglycolate phosphatase-like HAD superfamily hydrolase